MNRYSVFSLIAATLFAVVAMFGVREYLLQQKALLANGDAQPDISTIVVADQPLRFGKVLEPQSLRVMAWPAENIPEGAFRTLEDLLDKEGQPRYVMSAFEKNEPIIGSKITGAGQRATLSAVLAKGMKAVSIRVNDVLGVAGFVLPGDRVDIMLTNRRGGANERDQIYTDVLLQGVRVLAIDQTADDRTDKPSVVKTVTFEVSTAEAQKLTLATNIGTLSLALRNVSSASVDEVSAINVNDLSSGPIAESLLEEKAIEIDVEKIVDNRLGEVDEKISLLKKEIEKKNISRVKDVPQIKQRTSNITVGVYRGVDERVEYKVKKQKDNGLILNENNSGRLAADVRVVR